MSRKAKKMHNREVRERIEKAGYKWDSDYDESKAWLDEYDKYTTHEKKTGCLINSMRNYKKK